MTDKLTEQQEQAILQHGTTETKNISFKRKLFADINIYWKKHSDRYNFFSGVISDACYCLLHFGPDWRTQSSNHNDDKLDKILEAISNLGIVEKNPDATIEEKEEAKQKVFDTTEGFVAE